MKVGAVNMNNAWTKISANIKAIVPCHKTAEVIREIDRTSGILGTWQGGFEKATTDNIFRFKEML